MQMKACLPSLFLALCVAFGQTASAKEIMCIISDGKNEAKDRQLLKTIIKDPKIHAFAYLFNFNEGSQAGQVSHLGEIRKGVLFATSKQYVLKARNGASLTDTFTIDRVTGAYSLSTSASLAGAVTSGGYCEAMPTVKTVF
jgi:hypothetical protein